jgi:TonB family protein
MPLRRPWVGVMLMISIAATCPGSVDERPQRVEAEVIARAGQENRGWLSPLRDSKFSSISRTSARKACSSTRPPEALATPDPLLEPPNPNLKITVSFIVGTDGRVHSPFILESAGLREDRRVLNAVRSWRYRPATCNGVPTEAEAKVEFFSR